METHASPDKNKHIRDFLSNYIALPYSPYYAVLLTGPWGIGKTYLIKKLLKETFEKEENYIYVSLYGITTREELDIAVLQACFPNVIWKNVELLGRLGKTALRYVGINPELKLSDLPRPQKILYVFDDLERCEMPINTSLGYINEFIEHEGRKVVIVANEEEIKKEEKEEYARRREKLIGKTFVVQSMLDEALVFFIEQVGDPSAKSVVDQKRVDMAKVYQQSGLNNLRILQQTIWDFSRFFSALSERQRNNGEAVTSLLRSFFALSFEFKAGRLRQEDLQEWFNTTADYLILRADKNGERETSRCEAAVERYVDIDLSGTFLSAKLIEDIFVKSMIDYAEIQTYLDRSSYFVDKGTEPAWRTVWHYAERTEEEFNNACGEMEQQFLQRKFVHPGELLQVFGLRLVLAKMGVLNKNSAELVSEGKRYIDDLYSAKTLEPLEVHEAQGTLAWGGYGGLGIHEGESTELRELDAYLEEKRKKTAVDRYPDDALVLLKEMSDDPYLYVRRICLTNSEDNLYYRIPILSAINLDQFIEVLLQQSPQNQALILRAFKSRYEHGGLRASLAPEQRWLASVHDKLRKRLQRMSPMGKYRLSRWIESSIAPFVAQTTEDGGAA